MRPTSSFVALSTLALAACTDPAAIPVSDYCATAGRVELRDLCGPGAMPSPAGAWGSCSLPTRADAERLAAEARKYDERCGKPE
jgi:hypothetical protein